VNAKRRPRDCEAGVAIAEVIADASLGGACNLATRLDFGLNRLEKMAEANLGCTLSEGAISGLIEEARYRRGRIERGEAVTVW
jgi:hypothetical protein